jgi:hypothetical protein
VPAAVSDTSIDHVPQCGSAHAEAAPARVVELLGLEAVGPVALVVLLGKSLGLSPLRNASRTLAAYFSLRGHQGAAGMYITLPQPCCSSTGATPWITSECHQTVSRACTSGCR